MPQGHGIPRVQAAVLALQNEQDRCLPAPAARLLNRVRFVSNWRDSIPVIHDRRLSEPSFERIFKIPHATLVALLLCSVTFVRARPQHESDPREQEDVSVRLARFVESLYGDLEGAAQTNSAGKAFPSHKAFHEFHNQPVRPFQQGRPPTGPSQPGPSRPPQQRPSQPTPRPPQQTAFPPSLTTGPTPPRRPPGTAIFGEPFEPPTKPQKPSQPSRGTGGYGRPEGPFQPPSNVLEPDILVPVMEYEPPDLPQRPPAFSGRALQHQRQDLPLSESSFRRHPQDPVRSFHLLHHDRKYQQDLVQVSRALSVPHPDRSQDLRQDKDS
ncbi:hypothetical protein ISCGN_015706 [Ixodes scapularis]